MLRDTPTARLAMRTLHLYNTKTDDERLGARYGTVWCAASRTRKLIRCTSDCCNMHRSGLHRVRCCLWLVDHVKAYSPLLHARIGCPSAGLGYRLCIQARPSPYVILVHRRELSSQSLERALLRIMDKIVRCLRSLCILVEPL